MDFTRLVESFRWTGDKSWKREHSNTGFSKIADDYNQGQTPAHSSLEKAVSKASSKPGSPGYSRPEVLPSSKAKRRLVLASNGEIRLRTSDDVEEGACASAGRESLCSLGGTWKSLDSAETTDRMESGGMLHKSQARLARVLASDWYQPAPKLRDKRKAKSSKNDETGNGAIAEKSRDLHKPGKKSNAKKKIQCKENCSSKNDNMDKGGMLERALARLKRTSDLDWYKPGQKLCLTQKSKQNVQGDSKTIVSSKKTSKKNARSAEREAEIEFSDYFGCQKIRAGEQKQLCSIQQLPGTENAGNLVMEYNTSLGVSGQSGRKNSAQSHSKIGRGNENKFNVPPTTCNPERYTENYEEQNGRSLVVNMTADGLEACGNSCKALDDEECTLDISGLVTNGQQGNQRMQKRAGETQRKFVCEDLLNRSWSSDDGSLAGMHHRKKSQTRDRTNNIVLAKNLVRQRVENPSCVSNVCEDFIVADWSSETTSYAYEKRRQQRVTKTSEVTGTFDGTVVFQLNNEVTSKEWKRKRSGNISCKGATAVTDKPIKKVRQQRIDKKINVKDNVGPNVSDKVLDLVWSSDTSPPTADLLHQKKKRANRQKLLKKSKADTTKQRDAATISSLSDISSVQGTTVARKTQKLDTNALGQRVIANKDWVPPVSVHALIQEELFKDPWKVLVACMLLNRTSGTQTRQVIWSLFDLCPSPEAAVAVETNKIEELIKTLGLQHKRAHMIQRFSQEYLRKDWSNINELHGIGNYATDAYAIFCEGRWREAQPKDHKLNDYWQYLHATDGLGYAFRDDR